MAFSAEQFYNAVREGYILNRKKFISSLNIHSGRAVRHTGCISALKAAAAALHKHKYYNIRQYIISIPLSCAFRLLPDFKKRSAEGSRNVPAFSALMFSQEEPKWQILQN